MSLAIALCTGGPNSSTAAALARQTPGTKLLMLHVQRPGGHESSRRAAFTRVAGQIKPARSQVVALPIAEATPEQAGPRQPLVELLPILGVAGRVAQQADAASIYLGLTGGPDPSAAAEALQIWEELTRVSLGRHVSIEAPLLDLEDWQRIELARQLDVPLDLCHIEDAEAHETATIKAG